MCTWVSREDFHLFFGAGSPLREERLERNQAGSLNNAIVCLWIFIQLVPRIPPYFPDLIRFLKRAKMSQWKHRDPRDDMKSGPSSPVLILTLAFLRKHCQCFNACIQTPDDGATMLSLSCEEVAAVNLGFNRKQSPLSLSLCSIEFLALPQCIVLEQSNENVPPPSHWSETKVYEGKPGSNWSTVTVVLLSPWVFHSN